MFDAGEGIGRIHAVSGGGARGFGEDADAFVVAQGVRADRGESGEFSGAERLVVLAHGGQYAPWNGFQGQGGFWVGRRREVRGLLPSRFCG